MSPLENEDNLHEMSKLFSGEKMKKKKKKKKKKKTISICRLLKILPTVLSVKYITNTVICVSQVNFVLL